MSSERGPGCSLRRRGVHGLCRWLARIKRLKLAEAIRKAVEAHPFPGSTSDLDQIMHITISLGVATFPDDGRAALEIVQKSDQALFRAKLSGRNRTCVYDPRTISRTPFIKPWMLRRSFTDPPTLNDLRAAAAWTLRFRGRCPDRSASRRSRRLPHPSRHQCAFTISAHHNDWSSLIGMRSANPPYQFDPIHSRHLNIGHDQIRMHVDALLYPAIPSIACSTS